MEKYIALLRGINISGKNKISMPILKSAFEESGFLGVSTYINSGNVLFSSDAKDKKKLIRICEDSILDRFMLDIPVTVMPICELSDILEHAPNWWDTDKESVNYAIFIISPITVEDVFKAVGEIKPEYEKIDYYKDVIFWSAPLKTFTKTRWSKIASSTVNNDVTIRNANTVKRLLSIGNK